MSKTDEPTIPAALAPGKGHTLQAADAERLARTLTGLGRKVPATVAAALAASAEPTETPPAAGAENEEG